MAAVGAPNRSLILSSPSGPTAADILKHAPIRARGRWPRRLPPLTPPLVLDRRLTTSAAATARNLCSTRGARQVRFIESGKHRPGAACEVGAQVSTRVANSKDVKLLLPRRESGTSYDLS